MQFKPKSENELAAEGLLPDGEYPFTVMESAEVESKSEKNKGRLMFKLKINVHGDFDSHVYDYFADWFSEYKLRHFAYAIGLGDAYESGNLDARENAFQGRQGFVKIKSEPASGNFGPKNVVKDYVVKEKPAPVKAEAPALAPDDKDDDVPF